MNQGTLPILSLLLAAAAQGQGQKSTVYRESFDGVKPGRLPEGWRVDATNPGGDLAAWSVVADPKSQTPPNVLSLEAVRDKSGSVFNLCWTRNVLFADGSLEVKVRADSGKEDQGGWVIWRAADAKNYYIARYNPLESNFRIYSVKDGRRRQIASVEDLAVKAGEWFTVKIVHKGKRIEGWLNDKKRIGADDETFSAAGGVGLWTKADAASSFDDFAVTVD